MNKVALESYGLHDVGNNLEWGRLLYSLGKCCAGSWTMASLSFNPYQCTSFPRAVLCGFTLGDALVPMKILQ